MLKIKELLKFVVFILSITSIAFALILFVYKASEYLENEDAKKQCYETYATDNVILKKCNKYFEEVSNE